MKKLLKLTISLTLAALIALSAVFCVFAEEGSAKKEDNAGYTVVTAEDIAESSFFTAVQKVLNTASENADEENPLRVKVEAGEYELNKSLKIYGNTTLSLYGVTIKRAQGTEVNMLRTGKEDSVSEGVTGYYYENIAIEGGVFDADFTPKTMIKAAHAKNFSMTDVTLKNLKNYHMMEVAGIDGFTLKNCVFKDQIVNRYTSNELCYEAVQLDVLKKGHIVNCRSEDLPMKNVLVEGCKFENCPRGIGAHTAVLNDPFDNIVIKNNTFKNMSSAAVQTMSWTNCTISGNYIEKCSRAIALFTMGSLGKGVFRSSVIAEEGNTDSHVSDDYNAPKNFNTVVENNIIKDSGTLNDELGTYAASAISVIGHNLTEVYESGNDGSAGLPVGDYYYNGIKIRNNYIEEQGTGLRLDDVRNAEVDSNVFYCGENYYHSTSSYFGISARYDTTLSRVNNNYIKNAEVYGIRLAKGCSADSITDNTIDTVYTYGILVNSARADTISGNVILNCRSRGIGIQSGSNVKNPVERNRIFSTPIGIHLAKDVSTFLNCNTLKCMTPAEYTKTIINKNYGNNFTSTSSVSGISTGVSSVELSAGKCFKLNAFTVPLNSDAGITYTSSDEKVASVSDGGFITAKGVGGAEITAKSSNGKTAVVRVTVPENEGETKTAEGGNVSAVNIICNDINGVSLKWNKIAGAAKYRLMRKNGGSWSTLADVNSLTYVDRNVTSGVTYSYTVRAMKSDGSFIGSYDTEGAKLKYVAAPAIKLTNSSGNFNLSWNKVEGAASYRVFSKTDNSAWKLLCMTASTSRTISGVTSGTKYYFEVVCIDSNFNPLNRSSDSGIVYLSKPDLKAAVSGKKIKLSWSKVNGASKYIVSALKLSEKNAKWKKLLTTSGTSAVRTGGYGKSYKFSVKCVDISGKYSSAESNSKSIKIKKPKVKTVKKKKKVLTKPR